MAFLKPTVVLVKVPGVQGPVGPGGSGGGTGFTYRSGSGVPSSALGFVNDWYLDTATDDTYEKTGTSTWTKRGNTKATKASVDSVLTTIATLAPKANPTFTGTVSGVTKAHVGLGNVDNTADSAKPVSSAQQSAIDAARLRGNHTGTQTSTTISDFVEAVQDTVAGMLVAGSGAVFSYDDPNGKLTLTVTGGGGSGGVTDAETVRDVIGSATVAGPGIQVSYDDANDTITYSALLRTVNGKAPTSGDVSLAISDITGLQAALDSRVQTSTYATDKSDLTASINLKANTASPTFTGTVSGVTKAHVGLGNADNTSDVNKPISSATQTALSGKASTTHTHSATDITSGVMNIERVVLGATVVVDYYKSSYGAANSWPSSRPTNRTDITIIAKGPGALDGTQPPLSWMLDGDEWDRES